MPESMLQTNSLKPLAIAPLSDWPLVSILMSNRNYSSYLGDAIDSCVQQSYKRFEVIICDDGSTDASADIVKRYQSLDRRIRAIHQASAGQAAALNAAFRESTGEIICLLDSDDIFATQKLQCVVNAFRAAPSSGLAANRMLRVNGARKYLGQIPALYQLPSGWHGPSLFVSGPRMLAGLPPTSGLSLRRSVAEAIFPLPSRLKTCADTVIQYLGPLMTPIVAIEGSLGEYRMHGDNAQACKRLTEVHIRRLVVSEQEIWRAWRHYLASPSSGLGPDFTILSEQPSSVLSYAYARFRSDPKYRAVYEAIPPDFLRTLPLPYRWYLRASVLLPNWLFKRSFNFVYGQAPAKMFANRVLNECRNTLSFRNIKEKCQAFEQKDCPKIV
jgi:glycosyltransferase involved in cell wall biosynthesis